MQIILMYLLGKCNLLQHTSLNQKFQIKIKGTLIIIAAENRTYPLFQATQSEVQAIQGSRYLLYGDVFLFVLQKTLSQASRDQYNKIEASDTNLILYNFIVFYVKMYKFNCTSKGYLHTNIPQAKQHRNTQAGILTVSNSLSRNISKRFMLCSFLRIN